MCGFLGWLEFDGSVPGDLAQSGEVLCHRGPDASGNWVHPGGGVAFVHRRLSIIDIEHGGQPMSRSGSAIAYNGEVYNFRQLRAELQREGSKFSTDSDTEVILEGYLHWGEGIFERARGMFSLLIWDDRSNHLVLARDPAGQKPLYYYSDEDFFVAASELQALLSRPEISRRLNMTGLARYLQYGYLPGPDSGIVGIKKLLPGHYMNVKPGQTPDIKRYWSPSGSPSKTTVENPLAAIKESVTQAVERRLVSDVPVGAFLSGGIDSSIIVGIMQQLRDEPVKTVTVGFSDEKYDERDFARQVADFHGTDHHEYRVDIKLSELLPRLVRHFGEPFADSSAVPTYYVASQTRKVVKVALAGDGGDELFGGYRRYQAMQLLERIRSWTPAAGRKTIELIARLFDLPAERRSRRGEILRILQHFGQDASAQYLAMVGIGGRPAIDKLCTGELKRELASIRQIAPFAWDQLPPGLEAAQKAMLLDIMTYLPDDLLVKTDITTMMNSLECRCPFLDRDVIELAKKLPLALKIKNGVGKSCLRRAFADLLPPEIQKRGKMGFGVPLARWFREGEESNYLAEILLSKQGDFFRLIDRVCLENILTDHIRGKIDVAPLLWALVMFKLWLDEMKIEV